MNVRKLIQELAKEPDIDSSLYVRIVINGEVKFFAVEGIAFAIMSYKSSDMEACTTLLVKG